MVWPEGMITSLTITFFLLLKDFPSAFNFQDEIFATLELANHAVLVDEQDARSGVQRVTFPRDVPNCDISIQCRFGK